MVVYSGGGHYVHWGESWTRVSQVTKTIKNEKKILAEHKISFDNNKIVNVLKIFNGFRSKKHITYGKIIVYTKKKFWKLSKRSQMNIWT